MQKLLICMVLVLFFSGCYQSERNCKAYQTGTFEFATEIQGYRVVSVFERFKDYEVETFNNETDTSLVRWINPCEYILQHKHPRSRAEKKSVHIKILSTTDSTYTFEYGLLNEVQKAKGTAKRISE